MAFRKIVPYLLFVVFLIRVVFVFKSTGELLGPFIGGDEYSYFGDAKSIYAGIGAGTQYNPLYPLLIGFLNRFGDMLLTYDLIKMFNIAVYAAIIFPMYFLAKIFLPSFWSFLLALATMLLPAGSLSFLIWADPMYCVLLLSSVFFFMRYLKRPSYRSGGLLGVFLGLTFLTKQSGLVIFIAVMICLCVELVDEVRSGRRITKAHLVPVFVAILFIIPWIVRNRLTPGAGTFGYGGQIGARDHTLHWQIIFRNFFFNLSYLIHESYFVFLLVSLIGLFNFRKLSPLLQSLLGITTLCTFGIVILSVFALGVVEIHVDMPQGRYLSVLAPLILLTGTGVFFHLDRKDFTLKTVAPLGLGLFSILYYFNNVPNTGPFNIINGPDVAYIHSFFYAGEDIYTPVTRGIDLVNLKISIFFLLASVIILFCKIHWNKVWPILLMLLLGIYNGSSSDNYILNIGSSSGPVNGFYRQMLKAGIESEQLYLDGGVDHQTIDWTSSFWFGKTANWIDVGGLRGLLELSSSRAQGETKLYFATSREIVVPDPAVLLFSVPPFKLYNLSSRH